MEIERVAVIGGTGDEGFGLATRWAAAGIELVIGSRDAAKAEGAAERLRAFGPPGNVQGLENSAAAASAPVVVVTVPFAGLPSIYRSIAEHLSEGAVVIDTTVPVQASIGGKPTHVFGVWEGSAAQLGRSFLPGHVKMCAAFHSLSAAALSDREAPLYGDVLACGTKEGKEAVQALTEAIPQLRYIDAGPLENARIVETITALLIGINRRYKTDRAGVHITNLPS
ncbi:MAG: 8-hydroxy-5-deazaflavin:NADPH oxidoreductase [Actinomycetota bacterium]|jgi:NADPH-dependent F420 reductase|nr:8-hydroxy-5-deazaflavin:NADPH oxidoreductase [Actinomycetota bacterium]